MEQREPKRARQACRNCRRKKTRCSGEKPSCAFCARLSQECTYDDGLPPERRPSSETVAFDPPPANRTHDANLAARVALLESRLSLLDANSLNTLFEPLPQTQDVPGSGATPPGNAAKKFCCVPDIQVLRAAADVYFLHCQNQPYCYFQESTFRQRLEEGSLPSYLLYSFLSMTARFSKDPFFEGQQTEASESYARLAWAEIFEKSFSDDHNVDISTVQTANMLAVIDFVRGRHRLAWTKIGLSVRFAQSLRLNTEPEDFYSPAEKEERRRTFWSVYLLDKLVSPGRYRPPTLLDEDCSLQLPTEDRHPPTGVSPNARTLAALTDIPDSPPLQEGDHFALTIFMASILGKVVRFSFQQSPGSTCVPWDSRSEYARIYGVLLSFETYSNAINGSFATGLERTFGSNDGAVDFSVAGHFAFSHALYHLCHCLLHHPFLLRQRLKLQNSSRVPPSFLYESVRRSKDHATYLTQLLQALQDKKCLAYPSFYGYCAMIAGLIHRFHMANPESNDHTARVLYGVCIGFLDGNSGPWDHYKRMSVALQNFAPDSAVASGLLSSSFSPNILSSDQTETLWNLVDYGWLSDAARPTIASSTASTFHAGSEEEDQVMEYLPNATESFITGLDDDDLIREENIERLLFGAINGNFDVIPGFSASQRAQPLSAEL